jgi:hypothetical protein
MTHLAVTVKIIRIGGGFLGWAGTETHNGRFVDSKMGNEMTVRRWLEERKGPDQIALPLPTDAWCTEKYVLRPKPL